MPENKKIRDLTVDNDPGLDDMYESTKNPDTTPVSRHVRHRKLLALRGQRAITAVFDGVGSVLTPGMTARAFVPYACTITAARMIADQEGDAEIDIEKVAFDDYPTSPASIVASAPPTISSDDKSEDTTLEDWTVSVAAGDVLIFTLTSVTDIEWLGVALTVAVV